MMKKIGLDSTNKENIEKSIINDTTGRKILLILLGCLIHVTRIHGQLQLMESGEQAKHFLLSNVNML